MALSYEQKITIIELGLLKKYTEYKQYEKINFQVKGKIKSKIYKSMNEIIKEFNNYNFSLRDIKNYYESNYRKYVRIKKRIERMDPKNIWFATYTISDNYINFDLKRHLKKELNKYDSFIANADYGNKTNRLHYHAVIESEKMPTTWKYGFCNFRKIKLEDSKMISRYLHKITAHALKISTQSDKIIYSRKNIKK